MGWALAGRDITCVGWTGCACWTVGEYTGCDITCVGWLVCESAAAPRSLAPHSGQKAAPSGIPLPQFQQIMSAPSQGLSAGYHAPL